MPKSSKMDGYISIILLISVALTVHGTHRSWHYTCSSPGNDNSCSYRRKCIAICEAPEKTTGLNCCRGNSGTYPDHGGFYDKVCKNGICGPLLYVPYKFLAFLMRSISISHPFSLFMCVLLWCQL